MILEHKKNFMRKSMHLEYSICVDLYNLFYFAPKMLVVHVSIASLLHDHNINNLMHHIKDNLIITNDVTAPVS